jgi:hypothetical protein
MRQIAHRHQLHGAIAKSVRVEQECVTSVSDVVSVERSIDVGEQSCASTGR